MAEVAPQPSANARFRRGGPAPAEETAEPIEEISLPSLEVVEEVAAEIGAPVMEEPAHLRAAA